MTRTERIAFICAALLLLACGVIAVWLAGVR